MAYPKGQPRPAGAGRKKGTPNKSTQNIKDRLQEMGCDYIGYLACQVMNKVPCSVCHGKGKTQFQPRMGEEPGIRTCQSCWGSGLERIAPKDRGWAAAELLSYCEAKRKALEVTNPDGTMRPTWEVVFVGDDNEPKS